MGKWVLTAFTPIFFNFLAFSLYFTSVSSQNSHFSRSVQILHESESLTATISLPKPTEEPSRKMEEGREQGLPPNDELFQEPNVEPEPEPMEQDPVEEPAIVPEVAEMPEAVHEEPEQAQFQEIAAEQHDDTIEATFRRHDDYAEPFFMPTAYVAPQEGEQEAYGDRENGNGDGAHRNAVDNTEHTIWIDSDEDHDPEEEILKANFYLPYSDHNYDPPDPTERVIHPQEGPFMVIDGLDEEGNIRNMWMPDGYGPPHRPRSVQEEEPAQQQQLQEPQIAQSQPQYTTHPAVQQQQQQHLVAPMRQNMQQLSAAGRPVVAAQPFSIGGNQVEYADSMQRMSSRGIPITSGQTQYRVVSEYGGTSSSPMAPQGALRGTTMPRGTPTATIIRGNQPMYQSPAQRVAPVSAPRNLPPAQPTPGSYQHISTPIGGQVRRLPPGMKPLGAAAGIVAGPGILRQTPQTRPINVTRPLLEGGAPDAYDAPSTAPPPVRRIADVAPHRMTQEQRQEQQLMNRQRPQFPLRAGMTVGPGGNHQANRGSTLPTVIPGRGRIASSSEDLLRSPQRGQPILERKFQLKPASMQPTPVEHTYSTPVPKASDQLPAQLTEDPLEDQPTSSAATAPEGDVAEEAKPEIKSPTRLPGSTSPMKHQIGGMQKATPPHRMTQEEKNAHFAKLHTDKDKPATPQQQLPTSSASGTPTHPSQSPANIHALPPHHHAHPQHHHQPTPVVAPLSRLPPHHQDDTLAVVQSVFESNAPRQPDTPKDKEAISKIADQLRYSADAFTGAAGSSGDHSRLRTTSGGRYQQQQMMGFHDEEARRKRQLSGGRYDGGNNMMMRSLQPTDNSPLMRHPEAMLEPPHRQRGRPRGSTGPQQNPTRRWPEGQEPIAPHRAAGGARTLPPRNQEAPPPPPPPIGRNGGAAQNSDSESDGVGDGESWTMRCHCGMDHGDGDTVECEGCKTWQHMACMGLTPKSNTDKYKCERCAPRKLPITKAEARKVQRKLLDAMIRAAEMDKKKKGRKSDPTEKKQIQQPSTSRKSAPMPQRVATPPPQRRIAQLNEYSKLAAQLLNSMPQTAGADTLLEDSRRHHKAEALFIEPDKNALVTTENVAIREVILEVNGRVSMAAEIKRMPGGGNGIFMYDGLMKGTAGEDMGKKQEFVCIETKNKFGNATNVTRRSCMPNCVLKHVLGTQATLGIMIVATKPIPRNQEVTLPFDADWIQSDIPLQCVDHSNRPDQICPFEQERARAAQTRLANKDRERRNAEEKRRAEEERRRLEEEVRRERAERTKQMDEEAERERLEQERIEKEKKAKEKEEAEKKKKEEEKAAGSTSSGTVAKQAESAASTAEKSAKKDPIPALKKEETPEESDADSTSSDNVRRRTSRVHKKKNLEIKEHSSPATYGKRKQVTIPATAGKRPRTSSSQADDSGPSTSAATASPANRKRAPAATSSSSSTSATDAKKAKGHVEYPLSELRDKMTSLKETDTNKSMTMTEYKIHPSFVEGRRPDWIKKMEHDMEKIKAEKAANAATSSGAASSKKKKEEKRSEGVKEAAKAPKLEKKASETPKKGAEKKDSEKKKEEKNKDEQSAGPAPPAPAVKAPEASKTQEKAPESAAPKPKTQAKAPVAASPAISKESAPKEAPKEAPKPAVAQKEGSASTEGSVEKDAGAPGAPATAAAPAQVSTKKEPKRWSIDDYKKRPKKEIVAPAAETGAGSSASSTPSTSGPAPARRGFIPSTEGLKDVKLSDIPLDDHPSNTNNASNSAANAAPSTPTVPAATVNSPSTRSRTRGAASESADDVPVEHTMSLKDRIASMFREGPAAAAAPAQKPSTSSKFWISKRTRWPNF
ncbi:hypothetical protein B9Z55_012154 [Caenorhabditis nigoni]|uniref:SET domain-containing protein n=1 Tax=Caenorhabditis nigoni TaxID=1611254 RepID=A0A2G5TVX3_9PELO|nr:hypothetical protein B9Z55_012154 [Caenorhabditis nigoni]